MLYEGYHIWGMHLIWWLVWAAILIWVFAIPYEIPFQRYSRESPLEVLKRRLAAGQINDSEYHAKKAILER